MTLYKYKSIEKFKYFVDMLLYNRLYAAPYFKLNDPMEGQYLYSSGDLSREMVRAIKGEKTRLGICSLSRTANNTVMWTHYADEHKGVVVGVNIDRRKYDVRQVNYDGLSRVQNAHTNGEAETAKNILSYKLEAWRYEEEERVFVDDNSSFVEMNITEIILGSCMDIEDENLIKKMVASINSEITISSSDVQDIY